jgi:GntR family transcriptional regulator/MocR family aminotransferase
MDLDSYRSLKGKETPMSKRATPLKKPEIMLDQNTSTPLYRQLYERLRGSILSGQLKARTRLPSTRVLASSLGVSRTTTALAYELLLLEGYIESRVGDGTRVARLQPKQLFQGSRNAQDLDATNTSGTPPAVLARRGQVLSDMPYPEEFYGDQASRGTRLSLVGQPDVTSFPYEVWARLVARHARQSLQAVSFYQKVQGYAPLRQAIATHIGVTRGVHCSPEQIILTAGAQGALDLVARALLDPRDPAWVEDPGYSTPSR